jgi:hypothetical protein
LRGHGSEKGGFGLCANKERKGRGEVASGEKKKRWKRGRERERGVRGRERVSGFLMRGRWGVFNGKVGFSVVVWSGQTCGILF